MSHPYIPLPCYVRCLFLLCLCCYSTSGRAAHITGGNLSYLQLDSVNYRVQLDLYHECLTGPTIGSQNDDFPFPFYRAKMYAGTMEIATGFYEITEFEKVFAARDSCVSATSQMCSYRARYIWAFEMPPGYETEAKKIAFESCCHDEAANNVAYSEAIGIGLELIMPPGSEIPVNSSPQLVNLNNIGTCVNEPFDLDFSAVDPDGDSLSYHFYSPLAKRDACPDSVFCGPPFEVIQFVPGYSYTDPMGADSYYLDSLTGHLIGSVPVSGEFILGIEVREYRDGVLIGSTLQDIQLHIILCTPFFPIELAAPQDTAGRYQYTGCGELEVTFTNLGTRPFFYRHFEWRFSTGLVITNVWEPTVTFPGYGHYTGELVLYEELYCSETAYLDIRIGPPAPEADYTLDYDNCSPEPVQFVNTSTGTGPLFYDWTLGDGRSSTLPAPRVTYDTSGVLSTQLIVADTTGCADTAGLTLSYFPAVPPNFGAGAAVRGCPPLTVEFGEYLTNFNADYQIGWDFGDGTGSEALAPTHIYDAIGNYDVSIRITSPADCVVDTVFTDLVRVAPPEAAAFTYTPERPSIFTPDVQLQAASEGITSHTWLLNGQPFAYTPKTNISLLDTGNYELVLRTVDTSGCVDETRQLLRLRTDGTYFLPNAFTPNFDGRNDLFRGTGILAYLRNFELRVYDRSGNLVFRTNDPQTGWDGRDAPGGVYVWQLQYTTDTAPVRQTGTVALLR